MQRRLAMLVRLALLAVATCSWGTVAADCNFPPDHPVSASAPVEVMDQHRVYEYTDTFDDYGGDIRALTFCYSPRGNAASETLFTVEIRKPGNGNGGVEESLDVIVNPDSDLNERTNCISGLLDMPYCCIEQTLAQSISVNHNRWYALRVSGPASLLLRHQTAHANGKQTDINNGSPIAGPLYKPLFFFTIDSSDVTCDETTATPTTTTASDTMETSPTTATMETSPTTATMETSPTTVAMETGPTNATDPSATSSAPDSSPPPTTPDPTDPTTSSTTDSIEGELGEVQGSKSSSIVGPIAAVVGVGLGIVILLSIAVSVAVLCLKRNRQRQRKVLVRRLPQTADGFTNEVYQATGVPVSSVPPAPGSSNTYIGGKSKRDMDHQYDYIKDFPIKAYEEPTSPSSLPQPSSTSMHYEEDDEYIYQAPATSVHGLYAQFEKIRITIIPSTAIEANERLGSGQFGTVYKGVWQSSPDRPPLDVAIKTLQQSAREEDRVKFLQEGAIMGQFRHLNIVKLHGIVREEKTVLLVIELLAKTNLSKHLVSLRPLDGAEVDPSLAHTVLSYCRQVAAGMYYLSRKGFVHRDIAARNILLSEDREICKIADFGMSRDLADETYYVSSGGQIPVKWTAPEALHYKKSSAASDVWSFGCLMYEIWSLGHKPFEGYTNVQAIKLVDGGHRLAPPPGCPRAIYQLMINCWHQTTSARPSAGTLTQILGRPDPTLLKWADSDKPASAPQAMRLGAPLNAGLQLYPDLQGTYIPTETTDNDYEEPD